MNSLLVLQFLHLTFVRVRFGAEFVFVNLDCFKYLNISHPLLSIIISKSILFEYLKNEITRVIFARFGWPN